MVLDNFNFKNKTKIKNIFEIKIINIFLNSGTPIGHIYASCLTLMSHVTKL